MFVISKVFPNTYRDSVLLMKIASMVKDMDGVTNVEVVLGTEPNKRILSQSQLFTDDVRDAGVNDLIVSVMARDTEKAREAIHYAEEIVMRGTADLKTKKIAKSINSAITMLPDANLALISIPGSYVKKEALRALKKGLNLLIFSNNVAIEDEVEIKRYAVEKGLLVMGPDCGTAIINGIALGFANRVRRGPIGLVGSTGTGLQQVSVLLHDLGVGISHAIGTGSNDILDQVGGLTMIQGIKLLEADPTTEIIVVISKPLAPCTIKKVLDTLYACNKSVIANFLGFHRKSFQERNICFTVTLEETALKAAEKIGLVAKINEVGVNRPKEILRDFNQKKTSLKDTQKYVRGLYGGGTLAAEALVILRDIISPMYSNVSLNGVTKLSDCKISRGHCIVDLGADEFTLGKPHPMLEPGMRKERLLLEARDPEVAVILLDFVLGYGVHPDPVGATIRHISEVNRITREGDRSLPIVASVCGTDEDPQNRSNQIRLLEENGVIVLPNNAQASRVAALIALRKEVFGG